MKRKETCTVLSQERLTEGIFSMWLQTETIAAEARPGQFISLYCHDGARLLPRPISLCEIDGSGGRLRIVYRVAGKGTEEFSSFCAGDRVEVLGPLGNGFPLEETAGRKVLLMGGGIGIPPLLETAKQIAGDKSMIAGYRDGNLFLDREFADAGAFYAATEDGSAGTKGNVLDAIRELGLTGDLIFACGPTPMLRAVKAFAAERGIECYLSMEERMACGIGACLACVCRSSGIDTHSHVHNKRICKDGPVFKASEVEL